MYKYLRENDGATNLSGAMEADTIKKHGRNPKSQMSRGNMMQRALLLFAVFWVAVATAFAQDVITLKNGDDIQALVQEIGDIDIKYKKFENPTGPNYTLKKAEVFMIKYANGSKDVFNDTTPEPDAAAETASVPEQFVCEVCDVILLKNGMEIQVLKLIIGEDDVTFKKYEDPDGTDYTLQQFEIDAIIHANGKKEKFDIDRPRQSSAVLRQEFENRMIVCGFNKRVVVYDFLNAKEKSFYEKKKPSHDVGWSLVGIWINYQKRLVALRLDKENYNEIILPMDIIRSVESLVDGNVITTVGWWTARTNEIIKEIRIRIVVRDVNSGTQAYMLKIYEGFPYFANPSLPVNNSNYIYYNNMAECVRTLLDEFDLMMNH